MWRGIAIGVRSVEWLSPHTLVPSPPPPRPPPIFHFPNETITDSFSFKRQGYCFLWVLKNYTDQNFHDFYSVCYDFWIIYSRFFELKKENRSIHVGFSGKIRYLTLGNLKILSLWTIQKKTTMNGILKDGLHVESWTYW